LPWTNIQAFFKNNKLQAQNILYHWTLGSISRTFSACSLKPQQNKQVHVEDTAWSLACNGRYSLLCKGRKLHPKMFMKSSTGRHCQGLSVCLCVSLGHRQESLPIPALFGLKSFLCGCQQHWQNWLTGRDHLLLMISRLDVSSSNFLSMG